MTQHKTFTGSKVSCLLKAKEEEKGIVIPNKQDADVLIASLPVSIAIDKDIEVYTIGMQCDIV
jgi:hypothetical protein